MVLLPNDQLGTTKFMSRPLVSIPGIRRPVPLLQQPEVPLIQPCDTDSESHRQRYMRYQSPVPCHLGEREQEGSSLFLCLPRDL